MRLDPAAGRRQIDGHRKTRLRPECPKQLPEELLVAVGSLDEELRLAFGLRTAFEAADRLHPFGRLDGQVAVEGERLPVEPRGHDGQDDGRRPDERHHADTVAVARLDDQCPGIGDARHARFRDNPRRAALNERFHQLFDLTPGDGMFVQLAELQRVDRPRDAGLRQEAPRRTGVLDDEVVERIHHGTVRRGQHVPRCRLVRNRTRDQIERSVHLISVFRVWPGVPAPGQRLSYTAQQTRRSAP